MSEHASIPPNSESTSAGPASPARSTRSHKSSSVGTGTEYTDTHASEYTPLLARPDGDEEEADEAQNDDSERSFSAAALLRTFQGKHSRASRRWPSLLALLLLCLLVLLIIVFAFFAPAVVQQYAMQAATFEPTSLSIHSFTSDGVKARIQGDFTMDASKVKKKPVRDLGRFGTWIARKVETGQSQVQVILPEYGDIVLGTAEIPHLLLDIRNTHTTHIDVLADLHPGDVDGIRRMAVDWLDGRLGQLRVRGEASVPLKSGLLNLGRQTISQTLLFAGQHIPTMPEYRIHKLNLHEVDLPDARRGIQGNVSISVRNPYPLDFVVPPLGFVLLVDNCAAADPYIELADATTDELHVEPKRTIDVNASAFVRRLPDSFTQACPGTHESPMDAFLASYIRGKDTTVYVRGSDSPSLDTPRWIIDLVSDIIVPVPVPGHSFGQLIKNFTLANVNFGLPNPLAETGTPEASPRISAEVKALISLPEEMNFNLDVNAISADADVFYHGSKLGRLDLSKWQAANSTRVESTDDEGPLLAVRSAIEDVPLEITDDDVFSDVIQAMLFGGKSVILAIKANVNVKLNTALGDLVVRKVPAEGVVPVKPINRGNIGAFKPEISNLQILETGKSSITFSALVNFTNPTEYSAVVPYVDIHILTNGTLLGHATAKTLSIGPGMNTNIPVTAVWDPMVMGGQHARAVGIEFLSQYISGYNTTITLRTYEGTIPSQPALGRALEDFQVDLPTPNLRGPPRDGEGDGNGDGEEGPHFIEDATMHLFTSTATFTLLSPLKTSTLYVTSINATAFYRGDEVGHIDYDLPFAVPPGATKSPRLPVQWNLGSVGYDAVRRALGGTLRLAARAVVGIKIGDWEERIWYRGRGIGANIRL
ncbi:hypothetical protein AAFC00_002995 [Neodothiora populina]|uniref:Pre-rRNA processing protein n=1 Tax=Neodothiora populina TaxID=2781224 RepID=A0ABR3P8Y0_9PEZI